MCGLLRAGRWLEAIRKLQIWQSRVPNLPLWAEATLFLLQAKVRDELNEECNLDVIRSLYSLALIRYVITNYINITKYSAKCKYIFIFIHYIYKMYECVSFCGDRFLNNAGHTAATAMGETTSMPTKELTASVGMPDWIVTLRNEVIHGVKVPSLDVLRAAGEFMMRWLKVNLIYIYTLDTYN